MDGRLGSNEGPVLAFDRYVLDVKARRLMHQGKPIALPARAFELLVVLVQHRGAAVTREELYQLLWPQGFVEDGNLTQNIYLLRRVLDPSGSGRRFIETLPRHGYRFVAPVVNAPVRGPLAMMRRIPRAQLLRVWAVTCLAMLTLTLSGSHVHAIPSLEPRAALSYALGVYHWNMRTPEQMERSITYFTRTIRLSPRSPLGYAGLAGVYAIDAQDENPSAKRYLRLAERYRDEALARDPNNPEALAVSAFIYSVFLRSPMAAEREYARVFAFKPEYATGHHWHAVMYFSEGNLRDAIHEWELAHQLDPTSEVISRWLGIAYFYAHRPDDAIAMLTETINIEPGDVEAWIQLASAQEQRGQYSQAVASLEHVRHKVPHKETYVAVLEARVKVLSRHGVADPSTLAQVRRLASKRGTEPSALAYFFAALGKHDEVISLLRRSHPKFALDVSMEKYDPRFDNLRADPRFKQIFD